MQELFFSKIYYQNYPDLTQQQSNKQNICCSSFSKRWIWLCLVSYMKNVPEETKYLVLEYIQNYAGVLHTASDMYKKNRDRWAYWYVMCWDHIHVKNKM